MQRCLLVVDDDPSVIKLVERVFRPLDWTVRGTASGTEALALYEDEHPAVVILDLHLPTIHGIDLLDVMRQRDPEPAIVVLTGDVDPATAAEVMRRGAENYLTKPVSLQHLEVVIGHAYEKVELRRRTRRTEMLQPPTPLSLVGVSPELQLLSEQIRRLAATSNTVLLQGETGTGKNRVARMIHEQSSRAAGAFVELNCVGIRSEELQSALFGHEKGAFDGAIEQRRGLVELADGGTLLLDGVGRLPLDAQDSVLRFFETSRFRRLGDGRELTVDVRVIGATGRDLSESVRRGEFREDLYFRLSAFRLQLPPLRERSREDILAIAVDLLGDLRESTTTRTPVRISDETADLLAQYAWPGNIRELRNVLERVIMFDTNLMEILPEHLPAEVRGETLSPGRYPLNPVMRLEDLERLHIRAALSFHRGNRAAAARTLGIARTTLYEKLQRYRLDEQVSEAS